MNTQFETLNDGNVGGTNDWLTPPELLAKLGEFDLDPCASQYQPWKTAKKQYTVLDDGLTQPWNGMVYCNPPYGKFAAEWIIRMSQHGNGIALVFARTDTALYHAHIFPTATSILFLKGRLSFHTPGGGKSGTAGSPSILIAWGEEATERLKICGIEGRLVRLR